MSNKKLNKVESLEMRIATLERVVKSLTADVAGIAEANQERFKALETASTPNTAPKTTKKKVEKVVKVDDATGNILFDVKHKVAYTAPNWKSRKGRYAVGCRAEELKGTKLDSESDILKALREKDRYVQAYQFPTKKDFDNFKAEQEAYTAKNKRAK